MKRIITIFAALLLFASMTFAQSTTVKKQKSWINYPMGWAKVDTFQHASGTIIDTITNNVTYISFCPGGTATGKDTLQGAITLQLKLYTHANTAGTFYNVPVGSLIYIEFCSSGATGAVKGITLSTGFVSKAITGVSAKHVLAVCMFNGVSFRLISTQTID